MILGIDISTSKIGISIIDYDGSLILSELLKMKPSETLEARAEIFNNKMIQIRGNHDIKHVFVEQPFIAFSGGKTTAVTMAKLQRFNGMCCYAIYDLYGFPASLIQANKARGLVELKIKRGDNTKLKVIEWVSEKYPKEFIVEYTRHGNPKPGTDDKADSIVIANAGLKTI
jgi:hypothetical protein